MSSFLESAVKVICSTAGWRQAQPDQEGRYHIALRGGLEISLFSPDGHTLIMHAPVRILPEEDGPREDFLLAQAKLAVAALKKRRTTLALGEEGLILQRIVQIRDVVPEDMPGLVKDFLNDLDWWKQQTQSAA